MYECLLVDNLPAKVRSAPNDVEGFAHLHLVVVCYEVVISCSDNACVCVWPHRPLDFIVRILHVRVLEREIDPKKTCAKKRVDLI